MKWVKNMVVSGVKNRRDVVLVAVAMVSVWAVMSLLLFWSWVTCDLGIVAKIEVLAAEAAMTAASGGALRACWKAYWRFS